jgi:hypothetical protein
VVVLAGSRDAGYRLRTGLFGALVPAGVDLYLLENPLYGLRRPPGQDRENLGTVAEQGLLIWGMVEEARALLAWLRREQLGPLCVTGYSMGGYAAAAVGSLVDHTVGVAALAAGLSPAPVYTERLLSKQLDWARLARDAGDEHRARARLHAFFESGSNGRLPAPRTPQAAVLVGLTRDGYVPAEETRLLHARYPGARLHWLTAGHISAIFTERAALRAAVGEALERARVFSEPPEPKKQRPVSGPGDDSVTDFTNSAGDEDTDEQFLPRRSPPGQDRLHHRRDQRHQPRHRTAPRQGGREGRGGRPQGREGAGCRRHARP